MLCFNLLVRLNQPNESTTFDKVTKFAFKKPQNNLELNRPKAALQTFCFYSEPHGKLNLFHWNAFLMLFIAE